MQLDENASLWSMMRAAGLGGQFLGSVNARTILSDLETGSAIQGDCRELKGRSVLVATEDQLAAALALIELDGVARRLVLCPAGIAADSIPAIVERAGIDVILSDGVLAGFPHEGVNAMRCGTAIENADCKRDAFCQTEWVLFTSGTAGAPKMAVHSLSSLTGAIKPSGNKGASCIWATFYDMRRYGGLQIFLRAMLGNRSFILSSADESLTGHLERLAEHKVTHLSGTPSHWRRVLMSASAEKIAPSYVRLSGEIADQGVLDGLRVLYPEAQIVHAYASTEAGVGFEVNDGLEGFPAGFIGRRGCEVELKVEDGSLRMRSNRAALRYLGEASAPIRAKDGFVDTGDHVELRGNRYYFTGRKDGAINVGGQKVNPEEVEAVINRHPRVRMSLVRARKSPILGSIVVADVVAKDTPGDDLENEIREVCAQNLARHKVPALIRFVPSLEMTTGGKLARHNA